MEVLINLVLLDCFITMSDLDKSPHTEQPALNESCLQLKDEYFYEPQEKKWWSGQTRGCYCCV